MPWHDEEVVAVREALLTEISKNPGSDRVEVALIRVSVRDGELTRVSFRATLRAPDAEPERAAAPGSVSVP